MNVAELMKTGPVIPVIVIDRIDDAVPLARALVAGGVRVLEVTLRTEAALDAIAAMASVDGAIVGAGTVTQAEHLERVAQAGARFAVSPGLTADLARAARSSPLPLLPGVLTPSEVMAARDAGFRHVKFFPAEPAGGLPMLKAYASVFRDVVFCPTGGIDASRAVEYLAQPNVACVGGSWLTPATAVREGRWDEITRLARQASGLRAAPR